MSRGTMLTAEELGKSEITADYVKHLIMGLDSTKSTGHEMFAEYAKKIGLENDIVKKFWQEQGKDAEVDNTL